MRANNIREYVKALHERGIRISVKNNTLDISAPKGVITSAIKDELRQKKSEIINYLAGISVEESSIEPIEDLSGNYPLSNAQRRLWVLSQLEESSVAYNIPSSVRLNKQLDIKSFKRAINATIDRHEVLRTVFKEDEKGDIRQWVLTKEQLGFQIDYKDYREEEDKEEKIRNYISDDSYKVFDLEKGPLLRASILQVEDENYIFYYNMHHIISDGWSMDVLSKDVLSYYEAYKKKEEPVLRPLRIQYKDYSAWQLNQTEKESFKVHKDFWLKSLEGKLPVLNLPGAKQRPNLMSHNGYGLSTYIDPATTTALNNYALQNGGSLFIGLLTVWNILIYRYTSQTDIIIGTPVAGRENADLEDQIGFYLNALALRNEIRDEDSFRELFLRIKQRTLQAFSHQAYPFDKLLEELDPVRDPGRNAVFDVMLVLQNSGGKEEGITLTEKQLDYIQSRGANKSTFDLRIIVQEEGDYLAFLVDYNSDVYERAMIEGLMRHYKQLLRAVLKYPEKKVSKINYLSEEEKHELLYTFNDTKEVYPCDKTCVDLFNEQARENADRAAVVFENKVLTYGELLERSDRLARYLSENHKITAGDLIGIQLSKSDWFIISVLAILKTGAAYVPIDPEYTSSRKEYITKDAKIKLLITEVDLVHDIDYYEGDIFTVGLELEGAHNSSEAIDKMLPGNPAYVIYTSGSTGKPKGVIIEHRALMNLSLWHKNRFSITKEDRATMYAVQTFDASVWELFPYLISGACLYIIPQKIRLNGTELNSYLEANKITVAFLPTPVATEFMRMDNTSLRYLLTGGEKLSQFKQKAYKLVNNYGPTESTVVATSFEVVEEYFDIPIGKPIANVQIYIVNEVGQLQPKGVTGEICISGAGLARGYLNQDELTKEKFVANPFKNGDRFYKTGDLGKWLPDGNITFAGRKDDQVKIRGYRIEPGEIEYALQGCKAIEKAVVVAREVRNNEKELVAYIVSKEQQNANELRTYLLTLLPEYMLPTHYIQLEALPLTSNGKLDRGSLPDPQGVELTDGAEYVAPRNEIEEKLVKIWQEVLKRDRIGVKDDFFALGGHSLKIIKVINQINKQFALKYDLKGVYAESTIELFAKEIERISWLSGKEKSNDTNSTIIEI